MRKLLFTAAMGIMLFGAANAQEKRAEDGSQTGGAVSNRYGLGLTKKDGQWVVNNEARLVARYNFDPAEVPGWTEPWKYVPDRIRPEDMKKYTMTTYEYKKYADYTLKMDVYLPKGQGDGPFPFVQIIHGGGWTTGHEKTPNMVVVAEWFSSNGIACMSCSYTLSGQGTFKETRADLNDALKFIADHSKEWKVNPELFGFYGFSAGGHLSNYMGMTTPGAKMFIAGAGPADMTIAGENYTKESYYENNPQMARYWGIKAVGDKEGLIEASPIYNIPQPGIKIPAALIIQGLIDGTVNPKQSIDFATALMDKGASTVEFMGLPFGGHTTVNDRYYLFEDQMFHLLFFAKTHLK